MLKAENKPQKKLKHFNINLKVSSYCGYKRIRTYTFESVHVLKTKYD